MKTFHIVGGDNTSEYREQ